MEEEKVINKYDLQLRSNTYKDVNNYLGNGGYKDYAELYYKFSDNSTCYILVYPYINNFYLETGLNPNKVGFEDKMRVVGSDLYDFNINPDTFIKYANLIIDKYILKRETRIKQKQDENI